MGADLMSTLHNRDLSGNQLDGSIPPALGGLGSLQYLCVRWLWSAWVLSCDGDRVLSNNMLNGSIPPALGRLTNLVELCVLSPLSCDAG
jgi:hypothetical protein